MPRSKQGVMRRLPRPEKKESIGLLTAGGLLAGNSWTTFDVPGTVAQGNTASTRVGRKIRLTHLQVHLQLQPSTTSQVYKAYLLRVRDAAITATNLFPRNGLTGGYASTPLRAMSRAVGPTFVGDVIQLTGGGASATQQVCLEWDVDLDDTVVFDDTGAVMGATYRMCVCTDTTGSSYFANCSVEFEDA